MLPRAQRVHSRPHLHQNAMPDLTANCECGQLRAELEAARAQIQLLQNQQAHQEPGNAGPVQESSTQGAREDTPLETGRQPPPPPPPQPTRAHPDIRMILPDSDGMRVLSAASAAVAEWSNPHAVVSLTVPAEEKNELLFNALKRSEDDVKEKEQKLKQKDSMNHSLLNQLNTTKGERDAARKQAAHLADELKTKDDTIRKLTQQLQQAQNNNNNRRSSVQVVSTRGRFSMSRAPVLECSNCSEVFPSTDAANNTTCSHHPKPARELPNKMVAEVFPDDKVHKRYIWPCCKKIDTKMPPPCQHGAHDLRAILPN